MKVHLSNREPHGDHKTMVLYFFFLVISALNLFIRYHGLYQIWCTLIFVKLNFATLDFAMHQFFSEALISPQGHIDLATGAH